jgi:hypothetical protein
LIRENLFAICWVASNFKTSRSSGSGAGIFMFVPAGGGIGTAVFSFFAAFKNCSFLSWLSNSARLLKSFFIVLMFSLWKRSLISSDIEACRFF